MGLFSKLFKSNPPPDAAPVEKARVDPPPQQQAPSEPLISTPRMTKAYVPEAALATPVNVHERETVPRIDALLVGERPTVVAPEPPPARPAPRPQAPSAKGPPRPPPSQRTAPAPPSVPRPATPRPNVVQ
ncbi:MAG TPA: hypothetical protein VLT33_06690, partial [Labilithrix sp.]|nr:hypothetical protein [Labilithrix sp.]